MEIHTVRERVISMIETEGFTARRRMFFEAYAPRIRTLLAKEDVIRRAPAFGHPDVRSWIWNAQFLFACGYSKEANVILRKAELHPCEFAPMLLTQILVKHKSLLAPDNLDKILCYLSDMLPKAASPRIHPSMYNDNFSNMATYVLLVAGTLLNAPEHVALGEFRLMELCDQLRRCGSVMEYGSPTYSPINLLALAETACHAPTDALRQTALSCEERLWAEMATHCHAETGRMAGPYSRAYYTDTVGHTHLSSMLLWAVLGEPVFIHPMADLMPPKPGQVLHHHLDALMLPNCGWLLMTTYHLPEHLRALALTKRYPFSVTYMTECIPSDGLAYLPEDLPFCQYGGHRSPVVTYMTSEYAMGTAQHAYHEGAMSDTFHITCRNMDPARSLADTQVIYSRFLFNDHKPGGRNEYAYYGETSPADFRDEGRRVGLQHRNTAIVAYKPKVLECGHVTRMRTSVMIPVHFRCDLEVWLGRRPVPLEREAWLGRRPVSLEREAWLGRKPVPLEREAWLGRKPVPLEREVSGGTSEITSAPSLNISSAALAPSLTFSSATPSPSMGFPSAISNDASFPSGSGILMESETATPVFVRIHKAWFAFLPLVQTDFGRSCAVRIEKANQHVQISFLLYEGPQKAFEAETLVNAQAGFVCIAGTETDFNTMEAFMAHVEATRITDEMECSAKMWTRRIRVISPDADLRLIFNPLTENVVTATANGRPVDGDIFRSDMLDSGSLPFLGA